MTSTRIIISGGGTGGHIYPGIAIAEEIKRREPTSKILFVGAKGKMEMDRVPKAGYKIVGLPIRGLERKLSSKNLRLPFLLANSLWKSNSIINSFKPDLIVGTGGYASAAIGWTGTKKGVPLVIQEQNNYAGLTNKWLSSSAAKICVAYPNMENVFPKEKLLLTGNPLRRSILERRTDRASAFAEFELDPNKKTLLVMGGSGGAKTINRGLIWGAERLVENGYQIIWQTGRYYQKWVKSRMHSTPSKSIKIIPFISNMAAAYACADMVVCRAGALTIAEVSLLGLPTILIPSPNVADDHQTSNAKGLADKNAALMISDEAAEENLTKEILALLNDTQKQAELTQNIKQFAFPEAASEVTDAIFELIAR